MNEPRRQRRGRRATVAWCVYDWANSAFPAIITTFVFAPYFVKAVAENEIDGTAQWGWAVTASALVVALLSPPLGAIADAGGPRKPWLAALTGLAVVSCFLLWFVRPTSDDVLYALVIFAAANVSFEFATVYYNAMLPDIAPADRIGRVSGWGWGLGYAGGLICLLIVLFGFVRADPLPFGLDRESLEHVRVVGPISALWYGVFALPLFWFVPDRRSRGLAAAEAVRRGLANLRQSLVEIRRYRNIVRFLLARMIYTDGLNTLFAFGGIYAAGTFGMDTAEIIMFGIALNATA
ncbi:MAG: MFS transporter, partial [Alphaproteobacteria bacterium]